MKKLFLSILLTLGLFSAVALARAQDGNPPPVTDNDVNAVAKQLYCPVCENVPLDVCPTQACTQWRGTIREKLEAGWNTQQILDYFAAQYGERVLANPSTRGLNIFLWVLPPIVVVVGAGLLWWYLRSQTRRAVPVPLTAASPASAASATEDEYAARLEQELRKRL